MVAKTPREAALVAHGKAWAIDPAGGGKLFAWGTPGDFARAERFYRGKIPAREIPGYVAELHKLATGFAPGHAPGETAGHHHK